jgi:hypothetical protein
MFEKHIKTENKQQDLTTSHQGPFLAQNFFLI